MITNARSNRVFSFVRKALFKKDFSYRSLLQIDLFHPMVFYFSHIGRHVYQGWEDKEKVKKEY